MDIASMQFRAFDPAHQTTTVGDLGIAVSIPHFSPRNNKSFHPHFPYGNFIRIFDVNVKILFWSICVKNSSFPLWKSPTVVTSWDLWNRTTSSNLSARISTLSLSSSNTDTQAFSLPYQRDMPSISRENRTSSFVSPCQHFEKHTRKNSLRKSGETTGNTVKRYEKECSHFSKNITFNLLNGNNFFIGMLLTSSSIKPFLRWCKHTLTGTTHTLLLELISLKQ